MPKTRTAGISIDAAGNRLLDKRYRGVRIGMRLGPISQESAEERLRTEMRQIDVELATNAADRPTFAECGRRFLVQSEDLRSFEAVQIHVRMLIDEVGHLRPEEVHDATLAAFVSRRLGEGVSAATINRTLEVARTILHRAARAYRDQTGRPVLQGLPPLLTALPEHRRAPYPITWAEQDRLFPRLPGHLARMALFAINTGLRDRNVCQLQWSWEVFVPEVERSVFVIPPEAYKAKRAHVVVLNDVAWSVIEAQRGRHATWVFPYRGKPIKGMNNHAWQRARREVGLQRMRVHDMRHTFACRLRAAGVSAEDRAALLGHATQSMVGHYASADVGRLMREANLVLSRHETRTVLRLANG